MILLFLLFQISFAAENISLAKDKWILQNYGSVKPNNITFINSKINMSVDNSSSALIYKLDNPALINLIHAEISILGDINLKNKNFEFEEDSYFRFGLVVLGKNKLTRWAKLFSPNWVQNLFSLIPEDAGLDKIYFYNVAHNEKSVGKSRSYPQSSYVVESVVTFKNNKNINFDFKLEENRNVAAVWVSADADQTQSVFTTTIEALKISKVNP